MSKGVGKLAPGRIVFGDLSKGREGGGEGCAPGCGPAGLRAVPQPPAAPLTQPFCTAEGAGRTTSVQAAHQVLV